MLDTSCTGSFMMKTIEFKWDLLERIKCNSEDWDLDEGKESGITPKFDCVKSFMDNDPLLLMLIFLRRSGLNIILP